MTVRLVRLDDYRPPPVNFAGLYLNAWLRVWQGWAMLAALFIRGRP